LDIKPQNILKKKKRYALADFGFAIYNDKNAKSSSGTIEYLAP
jgi:serine/threonine protein kinase